MSAVVAEGEGGQLAEQPKLPAHVKQALVVVKAAYPNWVVELSTAKVWTVFLGEIEPEVLAEAVYQWCALNKWPPSIAELRELAGVNRMSMQMEGRRLTLVQRWNRGQEMSEREVLELDWLQACYEAQEKRRTLPSRPRELRG